MNLKRIKLRLLTLRCSGHFSTKRNDVLLHIPKVFENIFFKYLSGTLLIMSLTMTIIDSTSNVGYV